MSCAEHDLRDDLGRPILTEYEKKLATIDLEVALLRRLEHEETAKRLERLGFDVTGFSAPRLPSPWQRPDMVTTRTVPVVVDDDPAKMRGRAFRYYETEITLR